MLVQNNFDYKEDFVWTRSKQSMKWGAQWERLQFNVFSGFQAGGSYAFGSIAEFCARIRRRSASRSPGSDNVRGIRQNLLGFYYQDDIKLRPNFTLNIGLRYEFITVPRRSMERSA